SKLVGIESKARVCGICSNLSHLTDACPTLQTEDGMVKNLATQIGQVHNQGVQYQQKTDTHLQNIDTQIGQICTSLSNLRVNFRGNFPHNPTPTLKNKLIE
ncbi:hypothetical protein RDABS01_012854, partial [Bienertia sinuspersici]